MRPQAVAIGSLARFRHRASAADGPVGSCKVLGFHAARHAICTPRVAEKAHALAFAIHNTLIGKAPEEEAPAAQIQLNQSIWNALIRIPSYAYTQIDLPDDR